MLGELVREFGGACEPLTDGGPDVTGIQLDSRRVERGDVYAALAGTQTDGARFVPEALARGACALLSTRALESTGVPMWVHSDARALVGRVAARLSNEPARGMFVLAITGTNGKTTTAWLATALLEHVGRRPGLLGTVAQRLADGSEEPATHTTPDAPALWAFIERQRAAGGDALVLEASSHALDQERLAGLTPDVAVFTNLTGDHLDYHGTMERYALAKARLFDALEAGGAAVVNADDPYGALMGQHARERGARVVTFGIRSREEDERSAGDSRIGSRVDLSAVIRSVDSEGIDLTICGMGFHGVGIHLPLVGRHNVENALAALAAVRLTGASPSALVEGLATVVPPPGRLEPVATGARGLRVFVDYAHTEDALQHALTTLREAQAAERAAEHASGQTVTRAGAGRLICVFGCGGDRDPSKRAPMGRVAGELCDLVVVTSDNPRGEDPLAIIEQIQAGARGTAAELLVEPDRRAAIRLALQRAQPGDVVLIAGKGHERTQQIGHETLSFDDRRVALEELG